MDMNVHSLQCTALPLTASLLSCRLGLYPAVQSLDGLYDAGLHRVTARFRVDYGKF